MHTQLQILCNRMLFTRVKIFTGNVFTGYIIFEHQFFNIETTVY